MDWIESAVLRKCGTASDNTAVGVVGVRSGDDDVTFTNAGATLGTSSSCARVDIRLRNGLNFKFGVTLPCMFANQGDSCYVSRQFAARKDNCTVGGYVTSNPWWVTVRLSLAGLNVEPSVIPSRVSVLKGTSTGCTGGATRCPVTLTQASWDKFYFSGALNNMNMASDIEVELSNGNVEIYNLATISESPAVALTCVRGFESASFNDSAATDYSGACTAVPGSAGGSNLFWCEEGATTATTTTTTATSSTSATSASTSATTASTTATGASSTSATTASSTSATTASSTSATTASSTASTSATTATTATTTTSGAGSTTPATTAITTSPSTTAATTSTSSTAATPSGTSAAASSTTVAVGGSNNNNNAAAAASQNASSSTLSTGATAGVAAGAVVGVVLIAIALYFLFKGGNSSAGTHEPAGRRRFSLTPSAQQQQQYDPHAASVEGEYFDHDGYSYYREGDKTWWWDPETGVWNECASA